MWSCSTRRGEKERGDGESGAGWCHGAALQRGGCQVTSGSDTSHPTPMFSGVLGNNQSPSTARGVISGRIGRTRQGSCNPGSTQASQDISQC